MKAFAYDVYHYFPPNYFKYSQASLIRIEYLFQVYPQIISEIANEANKRNNAMVTRLTDNEFSDNLNVQVLTYNERRYKASILEFDCQMSLVKLQLNRNIVTRSQFVGSDSTFFYINGGIARIHDNVFSYNGMLTAKIYNNTAAAYVYKR